MLRVAIAGSGMGLAAFRWPDTLADVRDMPTVRDHYAALKQRYGPRWWERSDYDTCIKPAHHDFMSPVLVMAAARADKTLLSGEYDLALDLVSEGEICSSLVGVWAPSALQIAYGMAMKVVSGNKDDVYWPLERVKAERESLITRALILGLDLVRANDPGIKPSSIFYTGQGTCVITLPK